MCIAIFKPANTIVTKESLEQCFKVNPDGAGFMVAVNKKLIIKKGYFTFNDFWEAWLPYQNNVAAIHFRIRTHGVIDNDNCHPFSVNSGLAFIHNGVIQGFGLKDRSDTYEFNEQIMKPLVGKFGNSILTNESIKYLIEAKIGYSKFVMLDRHGNHTLFNESKGNWNEGVWYSNLSYKPYVAPVTSFLPKNTAGVPTYTPYTTYPAPKKSNMTKSRKIEEEDLIILISNHYDKGSKTLFKKGEVLTVVGVNKDYTVDAMSDDKEFVYNLCYTKFDYVEEDPNDIVAGPLDDYNRYSDSFL
jgi:glutamine amidotransferase